jgi:hypothetical protein
MFKPHISLVRTLIITTGHVVLIEKQTAPIVFNDRVFLQTLITVFIKNKSYLLIYIIISICSP